MINYFISAVAQNWTIYNLVLGIGKKKKQPADSKKKPES